MRKKEEKNGMTTKVSNVFPLYLLRFYTPYYFEELAIHTLNSFHNREFQDLFF
ncbi:hypothetical protein bcere0027_34670 [Bacillus cereus AH676]|nr:hypothetical protein bcere0012_35120 [Bacillus cereus BDRD-ST24]EEL10176.1 hypothetical protein bcere0015_35190 [Bacillus cereus BDRD-Cer4]EEL75086.1 hypothetical protein bcere0027_34670 [Bacillus cereus AH676]